MNISILKPDSKYLPVVAEWLFEEWGHLTPGRTLSGTVEKLKTPQCKDGLETTFIAEEGGFPVGVCRLTESDMSVRKEFSPWLSSVYVPLANRHLNIGRELCRHCAEFAFSKGHRQLYLFTPDKSHFYLQMGWVVTEEISYRNQDVTVMVREYC